MKKRKGLLKAFGINEFGLIEFPHKYSNTRISRILNGEVMGCSYCFPHGIETHNSKFSNSQRCWKKYRNKQRH